MPIKICTLCDSKYLSKGLAMRQSLIDLNVDFDIFWLCLDEETYQVLNRLNDSRISLWKLSGLERNDEALRKAKDNPPSNYGSQRDNYIWSLTPYFTNFILKNYIEDDEFLIYVDSDIFFYQSPQNILDTVGDRSIGIHTHRFGPNRTKLDTGWYNVGVTVFKSNEIGLFVSRKWKEWTLRIDDTYYQEYGTCGDQKFLEAFFEITPKQNISIFDEEGDFSHLAPWCCELDGRPIAFFHFSHFLYDGKDGWSDSVKGEWRPSRHAHIKPYYEQYFEKVKQAHKLTIL